MRVLNQPGADVRAALRSVAISWFIEYSTEDDYEYWLSCANRDGAQDKWRCYLEPKAKSLFGRNKAPAEGARQLMRALRDLLTDEPSISNVTWE